ANIGTTLHLQQLDLSGQPVAQRHNKSPIVVERQSPSQCGTEAAGNGDRPPPSGELLHQMAPRQTLCPLPGMLPPRSSDRLLGCGPESLANPPTWLDKHCQCLRCFPVPSSSAHGQRTATLDPLC